MTHDIPVVVELLYHAWVGGPDPERWPEWMRDNPVQGQGLYSFYQGLRLGIRLLTALQIPNS
ncbi:hypothetical protein [uncultured Oscillibacter sp.]|uniref:hypothetical protein n=1 Tax=uncultured Oscillibacter sp. TaxID=876091 RepID=UPI0026203D7C|nr:hypothetical protein [uncultured Oscillibacter sp.]